MRDCSASFKRRFSPVEGIRKRMTTSGLHRLERKSSIDSEPRTLHFDQIQFAREAALCVLNTKTIEEALAIFTEGLQPAVTPRQERAIVRTDSEEEWDYAAPYPTLPPPPPPPPPLLDGMRDVVSAPF